MAQGKQFFQYLSAKIDISPAGSEEELQAAHTIDALMKQTGLATKVQDFDTKLPSKLVVGILYLLVFIGAILAGLPGFLFSFLALVLLALGVVGLYAKDHQLDWLSFLTKGAKSQNVVGFHKASGPAATGSARKIVIVSHYDSGHVELLANPKVARYAKFVHSFAPWGILLAAICVVLELFVGMAPGFLVFLWIVGFIAAIPALVLGVNDVAAHFSQLAGAANDNNASLAAMLGVAADVSAHGVTLEMPEDIEGASPDAVPEETVDEAVESTPATSGAVRHGEEMLRELAIFSNNCEITYTNAAPVTSAAEHDPIQTIHDEVQAARETNALEDARIESTPEDDASVTQVVEPVVPVAAEPEPESAPASAPAEPVEPPAPAPQADVSPEPFVKPEVAPFSEPPAAPFESSMNPAQRASLFDLPDPEETAVDPLASGFDMPPVTIGDVEEDASANMSGSVMTSGQFDTISAESAGEAIENPYQAESRRSRKQKRERKTLFGSRKSAKTEDESLSEWLGVSDDYDAKSAGREISSWDNFDDSDDDLWKGGATRSDAFVDELGEADQGELADAVVRMDEANLMAHDIYFVAVGASELDHAGMKAFLAARKSELRGSYVVTLDAIGAGELTTFRNERAYNAKRATRRVLKTIDHVARDLHIPLINAAQSWKETETTVALDNSMRGVTLMGCEPGEVPALAHTAENVPEHVSAEQIETVNRLLDEVIRRV